MLVIVIGVALPRCETADTALKLVCFPRRHCSKAVLSCGQFLGLPRCSSVGYCCEYVATVFEEEIIRAAEGALGGREQKAGHCERSEENKQTNKAAYGSLFVP